MSAGRGQPGAASPALRPGLGGDPTLPATLALVGLTAAAAFGMGRLFDDLSYLLPFLAAALACHGVMWAGRRLGVPLAPAVLASLAALGLTAAWVVLPATTVYGLPWTTTLDAAREALAQARADFAEVVAPAPATTGFLVAGMVGVGVSAVLADWAAFRMRVLFEAVLPSFTLVVFTASLGAPRHRVALTALYLAALLLFLVVHHSGLLAATTSWFASRAASGTLPFLRPGAALGAVAVLAAVVVGPNLPGVGEPPLLPWRGGDGPGGSGGRTTVSPLVDIRGRLVDDAATEVFSVRSTVRSYWRLTSLDSFDGTIWSSDARYRPVRRRVPGGVPAATRTDRAVQEFTIASLSAIWLPAAYRPERVDGIDDVSYNDDLGSLITGQHTTDGLTYRVESAIPRPTPADLAGGSSGPDAPDLDRFVRLPPLSPPVRRLAAEIARQGDGSPYGRALALQTFFRNGFTYDLDARPGHDERALETFLFRTRTGYCEQFAGAYAVLARALGLPTRVAVGFTPGELGRDGRYHVRGLNAHAWPEVWLAGSGWVAFEPTPGRGFPGAEDYTGVPEAQARPENPSTATTAPPEAPAAPEDVPEPEASDPGPTEENAPGAPGRRGSPLRHPVVVAALVAVLAALALAGSVVGAKAARRRRRRSAAATAGERVLVAWAEAAEALAQAGAGRRPAETLHEHARRAASAAALPPDTAAALSSLATDAAAASYAPGPVGPEVARRAVAAAAAVDRALASAASRRQRLVWALDPRPLLLPARPAGAAGAAGAERRRTTRAA